VDQQCQALGLSERTSGIWSGDLGDQAPASAFRKSDLAWTRWSTYRKSAAQLNEFAARMNPRALALMNWYFLKATKEISLPLR